MKKSARHRSTDRRKTARNSSTFESAGEALGGSVPSRPTEHPTLEVPTLDDYRKVITKLENKEVSTTFAVVQTLTATLPR